MFIEQGYKSNFHIAKYIPFPFFFLGLMLLNFLVIQFTNIDVETVMKTEIERIGKNMFLLENLAPFVFFLGLLFLWVKYIHQQTITSLTTARKKINWSKIFFSFGLWSIFLIITTGITYLLNPSDFRINFNLEPFLILVLIVVIFIPIQTSFEEYLFRGYLMQGIGLLSKNRWLPLLSTSVLFGLVHISNPEVEKIGMLLLVYYIGTGLFLGVITLMDDGMELALGFHAANNLVGSILVTSSYSALQTDSLLLDLSEPSVGFEIILPVFIIFPLLLFIFMKKYNWKNWKEKLTGNIEAKDQIVTS
jgi:membrane protease YdiL (CAAX protease family)